MIDLHTHTNASDGSLTPQELVRNAAESGITAIAIADHDTLAAIGEALAAGDEYNVHIIPAVEMSVDHEDGNLHMLGLGINHNKQSFIETLAKIANSRVERNLKIIEKLKQLNFPVEPEDVMKLSYHGTWGRAHIAQALVNIGYMHDTEEAFRKLLKKDGPAYVNRYRLFLREAVDLVHNAGGVAIWAHPGLHENLDELLERLPAWKEYGLDGVESDYRDHSLELRDRLRILAKEYDMIYTGGSDFHGEIKPENRLGDGAGGQPVDARCLEMLDERRRGS